MSISRPRSTSVTFVRSRTSSRPDDIPEFRSDDEDDIQITLAAPYIQTYLAYTSRGLTCCGISLPIPFERSSQKSWWDPRFDSEILEGQYKLSAFSHLRLRFRYALFYILLVSISWLIYFLCKNVNFEGDKWKVECEILGVFIGIILIVLSITHSEFYRSNITVTSLFVSISLCLLSLCCVFFTPVLFSSEGQNFIPNISPVGHTAICIQVLLLIYTVIPLPLYLCVTISAIYSTIFEMLIFILHDHSFMLWNIGIIVRVLAQICVHLVGVHIFIMNNVRMRGTFMKVGQSLLVRRQLEMEKQLKEKMIHSVMPPRVADWLMAETGEFETNAASKNALPRNSNPGASDLKSLFRPFNMNRMENVSILFADIVGFTKMSSNKTAEELVGILNDLFERFDDLCSLNNCEKISTLGDCYYCVSGCPEPRADHAKCCVEMGLGMIQAIAQFDMERNEGVNMRVGIHTGTVLCGIVGTRRFKFDVWSNDVTLANRMESTGKPGRVHISERTCDYLQNMYILEDAESICDLKTYFIIKRVSDIENEGSNSEHQSDTCDPGVQLIISPPVVQISSQIQSSLSPGEASHNLLKPRAHSDQLTPNVIRIKANSLPSILDSETECEADQKDVLNEIDENSRSPTSTGSYGKYSNRIKNWRVPKFLFKGDGEKIKVDIECGKLSPKDASKLQACNGYQQIPTIIESQSNQRQKFDISPIGSIVSTHDRPKGSSDNKNDILDIKSYISQSRSDIGHFDRSPTDFIRTSSCKSHHSRPAMEGFERANSCRSQCGRSQNCEISVAERGRSATVVCRANTECLEVPNAVPPPDDQLSLCLSVNSRKDSGIRSTSRRSSIQQQIFALNQAAMSQGDILQHRVSGYYTSSQSSIATNSQHCASQLPPPFSDHLGACVQKLRKQSDLQLIRCVQDNTSSKRSYFIKPPLSKFTLFFKSREMESDYRRNVHTITEKLGESIPTLATARYNTLFDVLVSALIFLLISSSLFLLYFPTNQWLCIFFTFFVIEACAIYLCVRQVLSYPNQIFKIFSMWYAWHLIGAILVSIPVISILVNFSCMNVNIKAKDLFYNILILISIIHFCNFTQLNCWMKNVLATVYALAFIILIHASKCYDMNFSQLSHYNNSMVSPWNNVTLIKTSKPEFRLAEPNKTLKGDIKKNFTNVPNLNNIFEISPSLNNFHQQNDSSIFNYQYNLYNSEIYIDIILLLLLVWFLNREFEIGYRLSFHSNVVANRDKARVQSMKNQADWLLHNIIPKHVADQLKQSAKYSENHKDVGIIFASIVNFNEMYDESYMGGKEFLRVLNELIGDFDELLLRPEFRSVDKIKTIGSTFMAASGLNTQMRRESSNPNEHLFALMDFAIEMQKVIDEFNRDLLEFNLVLRIGYNFGDVTAGVIGTSKLYYDIWGDAVNIASRMDTTGVSGRIQVGGACIPILQQRYEFEPRGSVYVKGKDNMNVFLLLRKKENNEDENVS